MRTGANLLSNLGFHQLLQEPFHRLPQKIGVVDTGLA
jgi:hypothetical protein